MIKVQYKHKNSKDLILSASDFKTFAVNGEIRYPNSWQLQVTLFGLFTFNID